MCFTFRSNPPLYIYPLSLCSNSQYTKLFKKSLVESSVPNKAILISKYRGPCFGISMALFTLHGEYGLSTMPSSDDKEFILALAYKFTVIDTARLNLMEFVPFDNLSVNLTTRFPSPQAFEVQIRNNMTQNEQSLILLRVWSLFSPFRTISLTLSKWVSPHALFICVDTKNALFYFFDNEAQCCYKANTPSRLSEIFISFIKRKRAHYLSQHVIWRWDIQNNF